MCFLSISETKTANALVDSPHISTTSPPSNYVTHESPVIIPIPDFSRDTWDRGGQLTKSIYFSVRVFLACPSTSKHRNTQCGLYKTKQMNNAKHLKQLGPEAFPSLISQGQGFLKFP